MRERRRWRGREDGRERQVPYALAIISVSLKPITTRRQKTINIQFTSGMYICPCIWFDVCIILTRGKHFSAQHWLIIEKVADMTAWLATTVARVAMINTGQNTASEWKRNLKNPIRVCCNKKLDIAKQEKHFADS